MVVTGGGSGIGAATALGAAQAGARVAVVDRDGEAARAVVEAVQSQGGTAMARVSDVADPQASLADASAIIEKWGRIDALVTAAGFSCGGTVTDTAVADWDAVIQANLGGTWLWSRAVIPAMRRQKAGAIVTIASQQALAGGRANAAYIAAKGAILSLTRTMALDHAGEGIRVNCVVPGAIETPMLRRSLAGRPDPRAVEEASLRRHPLGRFGEPGEVAAAILFLCKPDASFMTGSTVCVDGGWLAA